MNGKKKPWTALSCLLVIGTVSPVMAGGLYISEFGQPSMGASSAGTGVLAQDASTAFTNPAGIMLLDDSQWMVTGVVITGSAKFDQQSATGVSGDNGGDAFLSAFGGAAFYSNPFSDKWGFGFALNSISGAGLDYGDSFVGRYWAEKVELLTINLTPSIAYRVNDKLSLSFSLSGMLGTLDLDVAIPGPLQIAPDGLAEISDGDDFSMAFGFGALYEISNRRRIGLVYAYENELEFDSDLTLTLPGGVTLPTVATDVDIFYPQTVRFSASQDFGDRLTVLATIAWEDWSEFDSVYITTPIGTGALPRNWDDTWKFALGMRWRTGGPWTYHTGIAYDTDPTDADNRTADMPIDRQIRLSAGATYERSETFTIGGVLTYADYGDADINNGGNRPLSGAPWAVVGDFSTNRIIFAGLNFNWK